MVLLRAGGVVIIGEVFMKKFLLALLCAFAVSSCMVYEEIPPPATGYISGCTTFCDDYVCREICARYYYASDGSIIYWDDHFSCWVGVHGYWRGGVYYRGFVPGYHVWYHRGHYLPGHFHHWRRR